MRRWKPQLPFGLWIALVLLVLVAAGLVAIARPLLHDMSGPPESWPISLSLYWRGLLLLALILAAGMLLYRIAAAATLNYSIDRNGLYISWLGNRAVIPLDQIQTVEPSIAVRWLPLWPLQALGYYWGRARSKEGRLVHLFSTRPPRNSLAIYTTGDVYAISPSDREAFVQDLEQRRNLGVTKTLTSTVEPSRMFQYAFWNDRTVRVLLLIAFALNLLIVAFLMARYPQLSATVEMRFNASGQVAEMRPRYQLLFLPLAAFGLSLFNIVLGLFLYRRQQIGARVLQGASVLVQVLFSIAVVSIIL